MRRKLIIDADPGIADTLAIAAALLSPDLELVGLTSVGGVVSGEQAGRNLQRIVSILDPDRWPRIGVGDQPAARLTGHRTSRRCDPACLNGIHGLGECQSADASLHQRHDAVKLLIDLVRASPGEITLLTLGPLTNIQIAQERAPDFLSQLHGLVVLGGSIAAGGDITGSAAAEYNILADTASARTVLTASASKTLVPVDVTGRFILSFEQYQRLGIDKATAFGRLVEETLPYFLRSCRQHLGIEGAPLPALVALATITQPTLFEREPMTIDVETGGELTRGVTVFERRAGLAATPNIDVVTEGDLQGVTDIFVRLVKRMVG